EYPMRKSIYENLKTPYYHGSLSADEWVSILNGFVEHVKREMGGSALKRRIDDFERSSHKNHTSLAQYIDALFEKHSKLLVLRIDLGYQQIFNGLGKGGSMIPYHVVKGHRDNFIRSLQRFLEKNLMEDCYVGYALKLEYGASKSWHYHT